MAYKDKVKQRLYQKKWIKRRRDEWISEQGHQCVLCGDVEGPFEVDHIDRLTKVSHRVWSWSEKRREEELNKCRLLCQECHYRKTWDEIGRGRSLVHGTNTGYRYGCRCSRCKSAHSTALKRRYTQK